ncbi:MAG: type II toxin-antitoxin system RelE/ParE family toxin [Thermodesulfobacteriota bacterium]
MAPYKVLLKPSVEKDLRTLPQQIVARVIRHIEELGETPFPRQSTKLIGAEQLFRIRVGHYRMIYSVDNEKKQVLVHYVRHRREAYRKR